MLFSYFHFLVWSHVHFAVAQEENRTIFSEDEPEPMDEAPTILAEAEVPWLILVCLVGALLSQISTI